MQVISSAFTLTYLFPYLAREPKIKLPVTCTATEWTGACAILKRRVDGQSEITTSWNDIVRAAQLAKGDICMFCFYDGGAALGCFVVRLRKY